MNIKNFSSCKPYAFVVWHVYTRFARLSDVRLDDHILSFRVNTLFIFIFELERQYFNALPRTSRAISYHIRAGLGRAPAGCLLFLLFLFLASQSPW